MHDREPDNDWTFETLGRVARRQRVVIVLTLAVAVLGSLAYSLSKEPVYTASSAIAFRDDSQTIGLLGVPAAPEQSPDKLAAAGGQRVTTAAVAGRVKRTLRSSLSVATLQKAVSQHVDPETNLVIVDADAADAEQAAALANAFARATASEVTDAARERYRAEGRRLQRRLKDQKDPATRAIYADRISRLLSLSTLARPAEQVRTAEPPGAPSSPRPVRDGVLAGFLGLIAGFGLAFVRNSLDRRLRNSQELQSELDLPVVSLVREDALGRTIGGHNGREALSDSDIEAFRILKMNLEYLDFENPAKVILVTSALPEEGKSTVATALACAHAASGRRTLLIDGDLRRPMIAKLLGIDGAPGLSDYLADRAEPADALRAVPLEATAPASNGEVPKTLLAVVPAGTHFPHSADLLGSSRMGELIKSVREVYDYVIVDSSPLLPVVDALELVTCADAVLLTVRVSRTSRGQALAARQALERFPPRPIGLVVTGVQPGEEENYGSYAYEYTYTGAADRE